MTVIAEVGAVVSVVGLVTGNKSLTKIGGVLGLVGGVGSLAGGIAGAMGASAATGAADVAAGVAAVGPDATGAISQIDQGISGMDLGSSGLGADATGSISQIDKGISGMDLGGSGLGPDATGAISQIDKGISTVGAAPAVDPTAGAPQVRAVVDNTGAADGRSGTLNPAGAQAPGGAPTLGATDYFKAFGDWATKNQTLLAGGLKLGGSMFQSIQQGNLADQQLAMQKQRIANANSVVSTGTPSTYNPSIFARANA